MLVQCLHGLAIELFVVRRGTDIDRTGEFHTQETAATRRICQYIGLIGGGDEGGAAWKVLYVTAVGTLDFYGRQRNDVFQESLLCLRRYLDRKSVV